jgi:dTDP-4-amino-4,6-dideoxygalactose transaminase
MKKISGSLDLAINGAAPAFSEPQHVGRPNIGNKKAFHQYIDDIFERKWLTNNGPLVQELEHKIAAHHGVKHCIAMSSGTVALEIAIRALQLEGEVIIPSYTFIATAHALHWQAITPVFADINPATHCIDPDAVRAMITPKTTGIIGVHLWGRPAQLFELEKIAEEHNLKLIFDAAHAFGCSYQGASIGGFGECEVLSFHATKFFNTFEGGAVLTNNHELADAIKLMRNFGFAGEDNVIHPGTNGKMTEISAAMGLVNYGFLPTLIENNRQNYELYFQGISQIPGLDIHSFNDKESNNYQYIVVVIGDEFPLRRDELLHGLKAENILARKYFWPGCHSMQPYRDLFPHAGLLLPNTIAVSERVIVLPTGSAMNEEKIKTVIAIIIALSKSAS